MKARARDVRIEDVEQSLLRDPSYRVRVGAALVLGRLRKPHSVPFLIRALGNDANPAVRASAATSLGQIRDPAAHDALVRAQQDASPTGAARGRQVAARAARPEPPRAAAGRRRRHVRPAFEVKPMGDRSRHAGPALRQRMRDVVTAAAIARRRRPGAAWEPRQRSRTPLRLCHRRRHQEPVVRHAPDRVEVICSVQLVISRQPAGGVFLLTPGEAVVQKPRHHFRTQNRPSMEVEALEGAVRGASEDLRRHLARNDDPSSVGEPESAHADGRRIHILIDNGRPFPGS